MVQLLEEGKGELFTKRVNFIGLLVTRPVPESGKTINTTY